MTCDLANQPSEIAGYFFCVKFRTQKFNKILIKMQKEKRNTFLYANSGRVIAHAPTRLVHTWQYSTYFFSDGNKTKTHWWSSDQRGVGFGKIFFIIDKSGFAWSLFFLNHFFFWDTVLNHFLFWDTVQSFNQNPFFSRNIQIRNKIIIYISQAILIHPFKVFQFSLSLLALSQQFIIFSMIGSPHSFIEPIHNNISHIPIMPFNLTRII